MIFCHSTIMCMGGRVAARCVTIPFGSHVFWISARVSSTRCRTMQIGFVGASPPFFRRFKVSVSRWMSLLISCARCQKRGVGALHWNIKAGSWSRAYGIWKRFVDHLFQMGFNKVTTFSRFQIIRNFQIRNGNRVTMIPYNPCIWKFKNIPCAYIVN